MKQNSKQASHSYKEGDILVGSFGYDATAVEFYKVIGVTPKGVRLVPLKGVEESRQGLGVYVVPTDEVNNYALCFSYSSKSREQGYIFRKVEKSGSVNTYGPIYATKWQGEAEYTSAR